MASMEGIVVRQFARKHQLSADEIEKDQLGNQLGLRQSISTVSPTFADPHHAFDNAPPST